MKTAIVFGGAGQLGQCLRSVMRDYPDITLLFPDKSESDILHTEMLRKLFETEKPAFAINCAAYTAVDKAEEEIDLARKINKIGVENLARLCKQFGSTLIHVSTDFVFEGNSMIPYQEVNSTGPINVYGLTKLEGEQAIVDTLQRFFILRTSWLYSEFGNNFVKTMLKLGRKSGELRIIADQFGTPTYAIDLANVLLRIIERGFEKYGLYHYSNLGTASWYDFATAVFELSDLSVKVQPIPSLEYITKARRPAFSVLDKSKIKKDLGIQIPYWYDSLKVCLNNLKC